MATGYVEKSIRSVCKSEKEVLRKIYDHMAENRKRDEVIYRPFTTDSRVDLVHKPGADFSKFFDSFEDGDYAFIGADMDGIFEREMLYIVSDYSEAEIYFNGEKQTLTEGKEGVLDANVVFRKGKNRAITRIIAKDGKMKGFVRSLIPGLRMGADDYVYNSRQYTVNDGFLGQEGVCLSRLYKKDEPIPAITMEDIDWIFPQKPAQQEGKEFDFHALCAKGHTAYVYTCATGKVTIEHESPLKIFANGTEIYKAEKGQFSTCCQEETAFLIKSRRADAWGFRATVEGENRFPFVTGDSTPDLQWIWLGPFGRAREGIDHPYGPERNLQFYEPYASVCGEEVYWRFYRENTYLRQYLMTTFYGQWFYAMMVGMNGMHLAADKLHIPEFYSYFCDSMKIICNHRNYGKYDGAMFGWPSFMSSAQRLETLDAIGTIGMNVAEYYLMSADVKAQYMLTVLAEAMLHNVPRYPDGTFYRVKTMWTDDMYMCLPFLARMGAITGEKKYWQEIARQVNGFYDRMFMKEQKIFSHIYFPEEQVRNNVPWGRGNGWVLLALSEVLLLMPEEEEGRKHILEIFKEFSQGVLACRDRKEGMWHQVINNHDSYLETSGSAMFITALARGVQNGWISEDCKQDIVEAWKALTEKCIDSEGNVYGVCMGSGCNQEEKYYLSLGTIVNDDHGTGIVLGAGVEVINMMEVGETYEHYI